MQDGTGRARESEKGGPVLGFAPQAIQGRRSATQEGLAEPSCPSSISHLPSPAVLGPSPSPDSGPRLAPKRLTAFFLSPFSCFVLFVFFVVDSPGGPLNRFGSESRLEMKKGDTHTSCHTGEAGRFAKIGPRVLCGPGTAGMCLGGGAHFA
jgi:hypothetical protein